MGASAPGPHAGRSAVGGARRGAQGGPPHGGQAPTEAPPAAAEGGGEDEQPLRGGEQQLQHRGLARRPRSAGQKAAEAREQGGNGARTRVGPGGGAPTWVAIALTVRNPAQAARAANARPPPEEATPTPRKK
jgi:hypothetical protein